MALPTIAVVNTAFDALYAVFSADKTRAGTRAAVLTLNELGAPIKAAYVSTVTFTVTDTQDASLAVLFVTTGQLRVALGRPVQVNDIFQVTSAGDVTDNALATAKGGAVATGDIFVVTNATTAAVTYLGNVTSAPLDFTAETGAVFIDL